MYKRIFILATVAVLAMVSCAKELQQTVPDSFGSTDVHSLSVGIEAGEYLPTDATKASMNAIVRVDWKQGDEVSVVNASTGTILGGCLTADSDGAVTTFSGNVSGTLNKNDKLYYIFPALDVQVETSFSEQKISLKAQTYDATKSNEVCFHGYAEDTYSGDNETHISKSIKFNPVTAYVHLNMSNIPAKNADLTSIDLSNVNGGFKWVLEGTTVSAKSYLENQGISVTCSNIKITQSGNAVVRFAVPASEATEEARVLTVNKAYSLSNYPQAKREAAKYYNQLYSAWVSSNLNVEDKGSEVNVKVDNGGSTESAEAALPVVEAFKSDKTEGTKIEMGGVGTITFDQAATTKILGNAEGSTSVFFKVEDVTKDTDVDKKNIVYEVTMKTVDQDGKEVFSEANAAGEATVEVPLGDNVASVEKVTLLDASGNPIAGGVVENSLHFDAASRILSFRVVHFSKYAIEYTVSTEQIDAVALIGERKYATLEGAVAAVQHGQTITLIENVTLSEPIVTDKTFTLTLNKDITHVKEWGSKYDNTRDALIIVKRGGDITINGTGKILSTHEFVYAAVKLTQTGEPETGNAAKLTVDGDVTLEGYYYGIVGNGSRHNTEITVNGGTFKAASKADEGLGIFHPQDGKLTINGGTFEAYESGIEVRGGTVEINGGTLKSTASPLDVDPNGSGSTTKGAALAIAQHTTKKDINVTVNGGTFNGYKAISVTNPQNNETDNVNVTYKAGTLDGGITLGHGTFNLDGNLEVKEPVKVIGKTTLNLGTSTLSAADGFTRTSTGVIIINRKGDLTVEGTTGSIESAGNVYTAITLTEKTVDESDTTVPAKLTVDGGNLIGWVYAIAGNGTTNRKNTSIVINGGTVTTGNEGGAAIYHPQNGTLTINGGTIESATGIYVKSGSVTTEVTGGTIKGTGEKEDYETTSSGMQSTGDAIVFDNCDYPGGAPNAAIKGGYFYSANASAVGSYAKTGKEPITGFISGGLFSTKPEADLIVEGKAAVENQDESTKGTYHWTVGERPNVAKIGDTEYATLKEAFAAVPTDGTETTIEMIADFATEEQVTVAAEKKIILDLNGKKISYTTNGYGSFIENKGQLKVQDSGSTGIITANFSAPDWNNGCYTINNAGTYTEASKLVIESGTIENTSSAGLAWPISNGVWGTYADLVINGGTIHSTNYVPVREYLQCGGKKTIVINGGKFISDNSRAIAVQVNDATIQDTGSSVTINGGEFTCNGSGILYIDLHAANVDMTGFAMTVNGGKFSNSNTEKPVLAYDYENKDQTSAVLLSKILKGGTYSKEPASELLADGYAVKQNTDGSWTVEIENFWPNFAASSFSNINEGAKTITISSPAELALLAKKINGGTSYAGYTISINGSLDMGAHYWIPINAYSKGSISGATIMGVNSATIANLKIEKAIYKGNYDYYAGFIAQAAGGVTFKDLTFSGAVSIDNGSGVATVLGQTYGNVLFDNVKVVNSTVSAETKAGSLLGFTGGDGIKVTVKDCSLDNVTVKAEYSYALMVGLVNTNDQVVFEGSNTATNSHAVLDETIASSDFPTKKTIKGYTYGVDNTKLWVIGVQDAWAECRSNPTPKKTIDNVEYSVMGDKFYHADGVVVDICAPDPVAKIGNTSFLTIADAITAAVDNDNIYVVAGKYTIPGNTTKKITFIGVDQKDENGRYLTVIDLNGKVSAYNQNLSFKHITFDLTKGENPDRGFTHCTDLSYDECVFTGLYWGYDSSVSTFTNCTFQESTKYNVWTYGGNCTFNSCTFKTSTGTCINVYQTNAQTMHNVIFNNCKFINTGSEDKAAVLCKGLVNNYVQYANVQINNCTTEGAFKKNDSDGSPLWQIKDGPWTNITISVNGTQVYPPVVN